MRNRKGQIRRLLDGVNIWSFPCGAEANSMLTLSLLLNIAVLIPICYALIRDAPWTATVYGGQSPARGILISIYSAILFMSIIYLAAPNLKSAPALLLIQIIYKITTPITVRTLLNPVVLSNLAIAAFHAVTLKWIGFSSL